MGRNSRSLIELISKAASERDFSGINHYLSELRDHLHDSGAPVDDEIAFRLIDSLASTSTYESMPQQDGHNPYTLIKRIKQAASKDASPELRAELRDIWAKLHDLLANPGTGVEMEAANDLMKALKGTREHFDLLGQSADRFICRGNDSAIMHVYYAQGLVDSGHPLAAIKTLENQVSRTDVSDYEYGEIRGLLGRANKQVYINHVDPKRDMPSLRARYEPYLHTAIKFYQSVYEPNYADKNTYHGINYIALLLLAKRHGVTHDHDEEPRVLATNMISRMSPRFGEGMDIWDIFTLGEAHLALGEYDKALEYYRAATEPGKADAFAIGSALRQIEEIWTSENSDVGINAIILYLKEQLSQCSESSFAISKEEYGLLQHTHGNLDMVLERQLPGGSQISVVRMYHIGLRAASVACIKSSLGEKIGTGFLVRGSDINPEYNGELLLMTNAHVMWDTELGKKIKKPYFRGVLEPGDAVIEFELPTHDDEHASFSCKRVLWQSESNKCDACLIQLNKQPLGRQPIPLSKKNIISENPRGKKNGTPVTVIGHPEGRSISIASMGDVLNFKGHVVDIGPRHPNEEHPIYLHYRIPTAGGSSGSPVLETQGWSLAALHHAGYGKNSKGLGRLNGAAGTNMANEGILISSILEAVKKDMKGLFGNEIKTRAKKLRNNE